MKTLTDVYTIEQVEQFARTHYSDMKISRSSDERAIYCTQNFQAGNYVTITLYVSGIRVKEGTYIDRERGRFTI